ncbi:MAG: TonB family protein [Candidatus Aminicenantes bacterium]|nr:TonB family protein [Candidatus Aminicenantes bacterium]
MMEKESEAYSEVLWRASQEPRLASLREKVGAPDHEWSANVVETLMDLADFESVNDLFSTNRTWDGKKKYWLDRFLGNDVVFRLETSIKMVSAEKIAFRLTAFRSKEGVIPEKERPETKLRRAIEVGSNPKKMDKILDKELTLDPGDPVVICSPWEKGAFFFVVSIAKSMPETKLKDSKEGKAGLEIVAPPNPLRQVQPYYPEELRRRRIEGKVGLVVAIDKSGAVTKVNVVEPLHPYLDYSVVQALLRWAFEPVVRNGKPVGAVFPYSYTYDRMAPSGAPGSDEEPTDEKLNEVLAGAAAYSRRLAGSVLDYVCEETISEIGYKLRTNPQEQVYVSWQTESRRTNRGLETGSISVLLTIMDPRLIKQTRFVCDYQLVKDGDMVKERRIMLKTGGRKINDELYLEEKRFSILMPILAGVKLLSPERQGLFKYRIIDESRAHGKECDVLEARPRSGDAEGIELARIWVDKKSRRILKCEIEGVPVEGYEEVLVDCVQLNIHPVFIVTHEYGVDYQDVSFPSRTAVRVEYPMPQSLGGPVLKSTIDLKYSKYRYFSVKTDSSIIK